MFSEEDSPVARDRYIRLIKRFEMEDPHDDKNRVFSYCVEVQGGVWLGMGFGRLGSGFYGFYMSIDKNEVYEFDFPSDWTWCEEVPPCPKENLFEEFMEFIADYT